MQLLGVHVHTVAHDMVVWCDVVWAVVLPGGGWGLAAISLCIHPAASSQAGVLHSSQLAGCYPSRLLQI